ncbi:MAG: S-adenosylhomocysteine deaminase [Sulfobacillus thermosulfidooxidans]|uniref:S-adenosylhomocysteine deaminase n=1 Tax=Sulfobacillus thermosulfidooxidans TaxID=28034 RepID=A0A2T2X443_SULTH|nr:MAG: S-adenosylhomocysteine deaminase [Sulfobacillus thermosulfidooxidans]
MLTRIRNTTVVTMNASRDIVSPTDLWIEDRKIVAIGPYGHRPDRVIDGTDMVAIPGLVQPHIHLCQTLFRGLADDLSLLDWLEQRIWPLEAALDEDAMRVSAQLGIAELLAGGTTTILDMGSVHHTEQILNTMLQMGIRGYSGKCLMDRPNKFLMQSKDDAMQESYDLAHRWHGQDQGRVRYAPAPRFTLSASDALFEEARSLADAFHTVLHTHGAETRDEITEGIKLHRRPPVAHLFDLQILSPSAIIAHGVWMNADEENMVATSKAKLVHCPSSNLKLGSGFAPTVRWRQKGLTFGIAADGAPCNNLLDGFQEMRTAALLAKPVFGPTYLSAPEVFAHATIEGARVLGSEDEIGSLEVGKQADIVLLNFRGPHHQLWDMTPIYSQLVYQTHASDVYLTMVAGQILYENGQYTTLNLDEVTRTAREALLRVLRRAEMEPLSSWMTT